MCDCCLGDKRRSDCQCWCHRQVIGGSRSGKAYMMHVMRQRALHPNGVVKGAVVTDSGEIER